MDYFGLLLLTARQSTTISVTVRTPPKIPQASISSPHPLEPQTAAGRIIPSSSGIFLRRLPSPPRPRLRGVVWAAGLAGTARRWLPYNGALGPQQLQWLRSRAFLKAEGGLPSVVFCGHRRPNPSPPGGGVVKKEKALAGAELTSARAATERVLILSHVPTRPLPGSGLNSGKQAAQTQSAIRAPSTQSVAE